MAKRSDMLRDKLNALKPSIPTNTRGEAIKGTEEKLQTVSRAKQQETVAVTKKSETRPGKKSNNQESKPAVPEAELRNGVEMKGVVKEPPKEKRFTFEYAFVFSDMVQENLASFSRIRDVVIAEANNMNSMYMKSCWKSMEACCDTALKTCGMFTPCSFGKWPFKI